MTQITAVAIETDLHGIRQATCPSCKQTGRMTYVGAQEDEDGTFLCDLWNCAVCRSTVVLSLPLAESPASKVFEADQCEMAFEFVVSPLSDDQAKKLMEDIVTLVEAIDPPAYIGGGFHPWRIDIDG